MLFSMRVTLLSFIIIKLLAPLWCLTDYIINYDYIVNNLCENKDKVEMQCNGKCYLLKKLQEKNSEEDKKEINFSILRFPIINTIDVLQAPNAFFQLNNKNIVNKNNISKRLFCIEIDHPPDL
ncbi:hypothetical protein [Flavivirga jejuensis]|uniref:Uncharacterized protein n=1 Tax=Flavivirga jejuensis TaxID=870487 RepID=A0ABT8WKT2_9FLAO|nr:hypothetical protein [Flavivirga jejuensis]MDO5973728.1 hypothetical protein [Flavivirga jejuensis]